jgi:hypothetical protein
MISSNPVLQEPSFAVIKSPLGAVLPQQGLCSPVCLDKADSWDSCGHSDVAPD